MSDGTFLVSISGQIEWIDLLASGNILALQIEDLKLESNGPSVVNNGDKIVLNFPVECKSQPYWCKASDYFKCIQEYGASWVISRAHIPLKPGFHQLDVHLSGF
ncbi:hypothetical protein NQ317_007160 [Molorchus minor]|uniref:Uncharacterized protein n=1 Tax=Molorchus minor TaxID=1323400 RepID=A0ABQ9J5P3_9CUCU|nr:hypothetical protein NQ317_007160 [Molorchus minor]